jgi:cytochrome c-type biogenesis protein
MEGIFLGGSLLAAFVAGTIALFAPCCITVLFPSYLAAAVRNARWRLVPLTLVFAAGVATVLVPVTLGIGLVTQSLLRYHAAVYLAGAALMLVLAIVAATGRTWSLPILSSSPDVSRTDSGGIYALGVFSGAASACCAPVLAGVLTLTAVGPSLVTAAGIGLAYVAGMVAPLLLLTLVWDRTGLRERLTGPPRQVRWALLGHTFTTTSFNLVMTAVFASMAAVLAAVALTGAEIAPTSQTLVGGWLTDRAAPLVARMAFLPNWLVGLLLLAGAVAVVRLSTRPPRRTPAGAAGDPDQRVDTSPVSGPRSDAGGHDCH